MEIDQEEKGRKKLALPTAGRKLIVVFAIALLFVLLIISTIPLIPQTRISVTTDRDMIRNVSVETPNVPLIVSILPSPSVGKGAYTIKVEVFNNSDIIYNSTLEDVPSGEFTFIWIKYGKPESGAYRVTVSLIRATIEVDTYSLDVEF